MKKYIVVLTSLLFCYTAFAQDFIAGTEDIPLMDNMVIEDSETVSFDTPDGQILNLTGYTKAPQSQVKKFYNNTLKTLGWIPKKDNTYTRDKDELSLTFIPTKKGTHVNFQLTTTNN